MAPPTFTLPPHPHPTGLSRSHDCSPASFCLSDLKTRDPVSHLFLCLWSLGLKHLQGCGHGVHGLQAAQALEEHRGTGSMVDLLQRLVLLKVVSPRLQQTVVGRNDGDGNGVVWGPSPGTRDSRSESLAFWLMSEAAGEVGSETEM